MMDTPTTQQIASYMKSRFIAELRGATKKLQISRFPLDLLEECNFATKLLVKASKNQSKCDLDLMVVYRTNEAVGVGLCGGARAPEQDLPRAERKAGKRYDPPISTRPR